MAGLVISIGQAKDEKSKGKRAALERLLKKRKSGAAISESENKRFLKLSGQS